MCLIIRRNKVKVTSDVETPTPQKPTKIVLFALTPLTIVEDNNVEIRTTRKAIIKADHVEQTTKADPSSAPMIQGGKAPDCTPNNWTKVNGDGELLVELFKQEPQQSGTIGKVVEELDEKQQMKLLEGNNAGAKLNHDDLNRISSCLAQAKKEFLAVKGLMSW